MTSSPEAPGANASGTTEAARGLATKMVPSLRMLAPRLLVAGVLPVIVYNAIRPQLSSDAEGLVIVLVFPLAEIVFERRRLGRLEPIGVISLMGIALGVAVAAGFEGSTFLLKVRGSLITGVFGAGCLASLLLPRPAMWHVGRAFATEGDRDKEAQFDPIWEVEGIPASFRRVTAIWGVALVGEAAAQISLALTLTTGVFLAISLVVNLAVLFGLIAYTAMFIRASEHIPAAWQTASSTAGSPS